MRRWTPGASPICASRSHVRSCWMPLGKLWPNRCSTQGHHVRCGSFAPFCASARHFRSPPTTKHSRGPSGRKRKWANDVVTPQRPHRRAVRFPPNQRFAYSRFQAAVCSMLERCALRADPVCCFVELAVNFFVQSFMLPCCAIAFHDFSGTNIGMGFRSVITDTDCYIVIGTGKSLSRAPSSAHIERQKQDRRSSYRRT